MSALRLKQRGTEETDATLSNLPACVMVSWQAADDKLTAFRDGKPKRMMAVVGERHRL